MALVTLAATVLWGGLTWTAVDGHSATSEVAAVSGGGRCALEKSKGFPQVLNTAACSGGKLPAGLLCSVYSQFCLCMLIPVFLSAYSE